MTSLSLPFMFLLLLVGLIDAIQEHSARSYSGGCVVAVEP